MIRLLAMLVLSVFVLLGCSPSIRDRSVITANGVGEFASGAHEFLGDSFKQALGRCLGSKTREIALACGEKVKSQYSPAWAAYKTVRLAWLALATSINVYEASGTESDEVALVKQLETMIAALRNFQALLEGFE